MHLCKILFILGVGIICINAKRINRMECIRQRSECCSQSTLPCKCPCSQPIVDISCGCKSTLEPPYGSLSPCKCQRIFIDEVPNYDCGCYSILNSNGPNYGRVPAIKQKVIATYDSPIATRNLPDFCDLPTYFALTPSTEFPCRCQNTIPSYQYIESPCNCRKQTPILDYLPTVEIPSPILTLPYSEPYYNQVPKCNCPPQMIQMSPYDFDNIINMPCTYDYGIKVSYGLPCGCENSLSCNCQYGPQLPALNPPCCCQSCQLSPVELPVYGFGCQSLPPPVIDCKGKYLRQVMLQPPFL